MYDPYSENAFRVMGLAAETEPALLPSWMEPDHLPPLWKINWLSTPERARADLARSMEILQDAQTLKLHFRTWFRKETPLDQKAFKAIEDGYWEGAADLWKGPAEAGEEVATQNLAVLYHTRAIHATRGGNPVWSYWTKALDWYIKLGNITKDPIIDDIREHIIEDLMEVAHKQAAKDSPEDVRLVLDIFRRAGISSERREKMESDLLELELTRLKHTCNKVRDSLSEVFRVGNPSVAKSLEAIERSLEDEVYPALDWLRRAQPDGKLANEARKEVATLLRTLSRAVRGRIDATDQGFMAKALEIAPEGFHRELVESEDPTPDGGEAPRSHDSEDEEPFYTAGEDEPRKPLPKKLIVAVVVLLAVILGMGYQIQKNNQIKAERARLIKELDDTANDAQTLGGQLADQNAVLAKVTTNLQAAQKKLVTRPKDQALQAQIRSLKAQVEKEKAERDRLQKQHDAMMAHMEDLKAQLAATR